MYSSVSTQQQHHHISFNPKRKRILPKTQLQTKICGFKIVYKQDGFIILDGEKKVSMSADFLFCFVLHKLCVYTLSRRLQFACHEILATLPTVSWLRQVILAQLRKNLDVKLNGSGFLCQLEQKKKEAKHTDTCMYPTLKPFTYKAVKLVIYVPRSDVYSSIFFHLITISERSSGATSLNDTEPTSCFSISI